MKSPGTVDELKKIKASIEELKRQVDTGAKSEIDKVSPTLGDILVEIDAAIISPA